MQIAFPMHATPGKKGEQSIHEDTKEKDRCHSRLIEHNVLMPNLGHAIVKINASPLRAGLEELPGIKSLSGS